MAASMGTGGDVIGLKGTGGHGNVLTGTRHMISCGQFAAAHAGFLILEAGGNAVDAGVAAGLALGVTCCDLVNVAGVAPIMIRFAKTGEVVTIDGLGVWPMKASSEYFRKNHNGAIPAGLMRAVVPAAPSAWITALERYGTMSFGDVAQSAIRLARDGFPADPKFCETIQQNEAKYRKFAENAKIFLPGGKPPQPGDIFRQTDLARSLQYMVDQESAAAAKGGRAAGLGAAHAAFYQGDIARTITAYHEKHGGWLTMADMGAFRARLEPPVKVRFKGSDVYTCGAWCQGPALAMVLRMLAKDDIAALGHNSPAYIHLLTEALKLTFADREAYFGDPRFVDVPMDTLLSDAFQASRRSTIDPTRSHPEMPPAGAIPGYPRLRPDVPKAHTPGPSPDTTYCAVIDRDGNAFSVTPSDSSYDAEAVPGTGFVPSGRGSQSWTVAGHPSEVAPFKRPRLTPNPAIAVIDGHAVMPFGTPGGDVQTQAMLQVFLNVTAFGMDLRSAIEAPRFSTYSFPSSFEPHEYYPNRLAVEGRIAAATVEALRGLGHDMLQWPEWNRLAGSVCAVIHDTHAGVYTGAADPRRAGYAVGW